MILSIQVHCLAQITRAHDLVELFYEYRLTDWQTYWQTDRQTDRQKERERRIKTGTFWGMSIEIFSCLNFGILIIQTVTSHSCICSFYWDKILPKSYNLLVRRQSASASLYLSQCCPAAPSCHLAISYLSDGSPEGCSRRWIFLTANQLSSFLGSIQS